MNSLEERILIRTLHLVLSIPIIGFIYGPVAHIPPAAAFTRFVAVPLVILSGVWMWQKPRLVRWLRRRRAS
jgi:thiosulfate reductase cytochrome b subunit